MEIKTERLVLRTPRMTDVDGIVRGIGNINVSRWLLAVAHPYKKSDAAKWVKRKQMEKNKRNKEDYQFGIVLRENEEYVGGIGIHHVDRRQATATLGYWLAQQHWRKGYGSEALEAVLDLAFNKLKLRRVEAGVFKGNPSSGKLLEKFGFKLEGTRRKAMVSMATGKLHDEHIYALLKEDYK